MTILNASVSADFDTSLDAKYVKSCLGSNT